VLSKNKQIALLFERTMFKNVARINAKKLMEFGPFRNMKKTCSKKEYIEMLVIYRRKMLPELPIKPGYAKRNVSQCLSKPSQLKCCPKQ